MRQRVVAYVTRLRDGRRELLVFDHRDHPDALTQVPAGRLDPGESVEEGLRRELLEEAGIEGASIVRELPAGALEHGRGYENRLLEVAVEDELPDEWDHVVTGDGDDAGYVFRYRWVPLDEAVLWGSSDAGVEALRRQP